MKLTTNDILIEGSIQGGCKVSFFAPDLPYTADLMHKYTGRPISVEIKAKRENRSLDANALLWKCIGDITEALNADSGVRKVEKWDIYLNMLKKYGKYTHVVCRSGKPLIELQKQWRETEIVGEVTVIGESGEPQKAMQVLCYFGSSTYNTKEFAYLLDGVISEMKEMGLETPTSKEMQATLEAWENSK